MKHLYLFRGVSGSGKTLAAEGLTENHVAADNFRINADGEYDIDTISNQDAHRLCRSYVEQMMLAGVTPIIVHNTFVKPWEMSEYETLALNNDYIIHSLIVEPRFHRGINTHDVPAGVLKRQRFNFDVRLTNTQLLTDLSLEDVIQRMKHCMQRPDYHPEGDTWTHTLAVVGQCVLAGEPDWLCRMSFFHDMGKLDTTQWNQEKGYITSYDHAKFSVEYYKRYSASYEARIAWAIFNHMQPKFIKATSGNPLLRHHYWADLDRWSTYDDMPALWESGKQNEAIAAGKTYVSNMKDLRHGT